MSENRQKRAVSDSAKQLRREAVLQAARDLFVETGFFDVSMSMIAKRAGVAKGTVYIYFKTKEEIFLALSLVELESWLSQWAAALAIAPGALSNAQFISVLRKTFTGRKPMYRLISLMHLVLEKNVAYDEALSFKRQLSVMTAEVAELIEKRLPYLGKGQGVMVLFNLHCLVVGWSQMTETSPVLDRVLENPELAAFRFEFEDSLFASFSVFLDGLRARGSSKTENRI